MGHSRDNNIACDPKRMLRCKPAKIGVRELYGLYVRFMNRAGLTIVSLEPNEECRRRFLAIHRIKSRQEFEAAIVRLMRTPRQLAAFMSILGAGFSLDVTPKTRRVWENILYRAAR